MLTKEQIDKCFKQPGENGLGRSRYDIARAIEAECAKAEQQEILYQIWRSTDSCGEFYSWDDCDKYDYDQANSDDRRILYLAPPDLVAENERLQDALFVERGMRRLANGECDQAQQRIAELEADLRTAFEQRTTFANHAVDQEQRIAELEAERASFQMNYRMKCDAETKALTSTLEKARDALNSCGVSETDGSDHYSRWQVQEAIATIDEVLK